VGTRKRAGAPPIRRTKDQLICKDAISQGCRAQHRRKGLNFYKISDLDVLGNAAKQSGNSQASMKKTALRPEKLNGYISSLDHLR
jgi:hypothetical protein